MVVITNHVGAFKWFSLYFRQHLRRCCPIKGALGPSRRSTRQDSGLSYPALLITSISLYCLRKHRHRLLTVKSIRIERKLTEKKTVFLQLLVYYSKKYVFFLAPGSNESYDKKFLRSKSTRDEVA